MASNTPQINYFSRDFETLRNSLVNYARTYFPNTYNDFSPSSTGMMFINMAAYVGDILSFYLDNQVQETFIQYAKQEENIYALAYLLGYKPKVSTPAVTTIDFYQQLPAITSGSIQVPDYSYALTIPQGTVVSTAFGVPANFNTLNKVDFSFSSSLDPTEITVYTVSNGIPTYFLAKKSVQAVEGTVKTKSFSFGGPQEFPTVLITDSNIVNIQSCTDTAGNVWYEVDNLAQDLIYDTKANTTTNDPNSPPTDISDTPNLLQLKKVERRFATRFINNTTLEIQFGNGGANNTTEEIIPNPNNVGLGLTIGQSKLTTAFSPTNFIFSNTYGISPANTILTFQYLTSNGTSGNVSVNSLTQFSKASLTFKTVGLDSSVSNLVVNSVTAANPSAASGGGDGDTLNEVKQNALGNFQSQLRAVTPEDYIIRTYSLPAELGTISKAFVTSEKLTTLQQGETPSILNLYILSKDRLGNFTTANDSLKKNLKTYLSQYRSISDTIKIKDAFIINIGINFEITVLPQYNNNLVLSNCIAALKDYFNIDKWQINQPIAISDISAILLQVKGVQSVVKIEITNKQDNTGAIYSPYGYDIAGATKNGNVYPSLDPAIFEVRYPNIDIQGRVVI
jgi:hypothetical protein